MRANTSQIACRKAMPVNKALEFIGQPRKEVLDFGTFDAFMLGVRAIPPAFAGLAADRGWYA